jgi:hypothetical protein
MCSRLPCGHSFCTDCTEKWLTHGKEEKKRERCCPLCRQPVWQITKPSKAYSAGYQALKALGGHEDTRETPPGISDELWIIWEPGPDDDDTDIEADIERPIPDIRSQISLNSDEEIERSLILNHNIDPGPYIDTHSSDEDYREEDPDAQ